MHVRVVKKCIMSAAEKFLKIFKNEALDYFCSKVCKIESDKEMSLSYSIFKYISIFFCLYVSVYMFLYKNLSI